MHFAVAIVKREQSDHVTDCYFYMTNINGFTRKNKSKILYPHCKSTMKPVPHDPNQPPLHIKLGLMKNVVKAMDQDGEEFKCLKKLFGADKIVAKLKAEVTRPIYLSYHSLHCWTACDLRVVGFPPLESSVCTINS